MKLTRKTAAWLRTSAITVLLSICILCSMVGAAVMGPEIAEAQSAVEPTQIVSFIKEEPAPIAADPVLEQNDVPVEIAEVLAENVPETVHTVFVEQTEIPDDLVKIDNFTATAYHTTGKTATGTWTSVKHTLAVNPRKIPYGTHVWLFRQDDGSFIGDFIAEDSGGNMLDNPYVVDIYLGENAEQDCLDWGAPIVEIYYSPSEKQ